MTKVRKWTVFVLLLDLAGTALLFFAFRITPTDFVITKTDKGETAFCVGKSALFVANREGGMGIGTTCPNWEEGIPIAAIYTAHPSFVTWGFLAILTGFLVQLWVTARPEKRVSRAERRRREKEEWKKQKKRD